MVLTVFFTSLETRQAVDCKDYVQVAGELVQALHTTLADTDKLCSIMHADGLQDARVEVEVQQTADAPSATVIARALVQADAPSKLVFDKNRFTSLVRSELEFAVNITKRAVSKEELDQ